MWAVSAITTIVLVWVTKLALREQYYSAVMAATGLLYLAILTAFGTDVVARAARPVTGLLLVGGTTDNPAAPGGSAAFAW